jgi:hypothetical protein
MKATTNRKMELNTEFMVIKNTLINYLNARYELILELESTKLSTNDLINYGELSLPSKISWKEIFLASKRVTEIHSKDGEMK